ncbi:MAG: MerR family DNA-binding transcriptional regulator [Gammaproteobacteria bacterium]|nr:MerR family DNA-binding transcriptional regulator [Gammaproteobacteria bacterium]
MDQREAIGIGDLAREFDLTTRAIRFYEDQGLLNPARQGQTRVYSQRDRVRLMLILRSKRLGFSIKETKETLDVYDSPEGEFGQLQRALEQIRERKSELREQAQDIKVILDELEDIETRCRERLSQMEAPEPQSVGSTSV